MKVVLVALLMVLLAACTQPGTCNNNISGSSNFANCGGTGDGQDASQVTPAPVVVEPVVIVPPAEEEG